MRVIFVQRGAAADVAWRGSTVPTGSVKWPAVGRRLVRRLNVHGDGQADLVAHGGERRAVDGHDRSAHEPWSVIAWRFSAA
jgi:MOSC domain-containing protein YiiM